MSDSTGIPVAKGFKTERSKPAVRKKAPSTRRPRWTPTSTLIALPCSAQPHLLPTVRANARRQVTDAEVVTLCVAQAIMGIPSDRHFLAVARRQLGHLCPHRPGQSGYHTRRRALAETIEQMIGVCALAARDPLTGCC